MAIILAMPTMDTMDTHMPTIMVTTMARGPLMPNQKLRPLLVSIMAITDMAIILAMPIMDTMDTPMPTTMVTTMARGPLMPSLLRMLPMVIMDMLTTLITSDMPTMDTHMATMDSMDIIINLLLFVEN